jgi:hypothetical protein
LLFSASPCLRGQVFGFGCASAMLLVRSRLSISSLPDRLKSEGHDE